MRYPQFSIVTVVFNGAESLPKTIDSVLSQSEAAFECIVIDGGSTDGTPEIIERYGERLSQSRVDIPFKWMSENDEGIYDAMNKGIDLARGEWILFMNCGDRFADNTVLSDFDSQDFRNIDIVFGDAMIEYPTFNVKFQNQPLPEMWKRMPFCHQAAFVKTSVMKSFRFDQRYRLSADFDFVYRAYLANLTFRYFDRIICFFNNKQGASINNAMESVRERRSIVLGHGFSLRKWVHYKSLILYIQGTIVTKHLLGDRLSQFITRLLRK